MKAHQYYLYCEPTLGKEHFKVPESASEAPYLIGSECRLCHTTFFPKKRACPICGKKGTMAEKPLSRRGRIYSFSYCKVAPQGITPPYIIGLVDLPEGLRIASIITVNNPSPTAVEIGEEVMLTCGKTSVDEQGRDIVGYMFKPVKDRTV